ncbi:MAG: MlaD family protein [Muribaculaceae bacterium]|nr:MlaD family protein [Muribaculaceae bacterium]
MKKIVNKELVIGISVIATIAILVFGIDYLKGINLFSPANFYYVDYENVSGLEVSSPVQIDGFKVGQVREISFDYDNPGKIKVLLALDKKLRIPEDSHAALSSTLMGSGYVEITLGQSKKMLDVGGTISAGGSNGLMAKLSDDIMPAVNSILPRIDSLVYNLNRVAGDPALTAAIQRLDGITANLSGISANALSMSRGLNSAVQRDVPVVMTNARHITTKLDSVSSNLYVLSNQLKSLPLNSTMDNVNAITENLNKFSKQLNDPNSTLGMLTNDPELYYRINRVAADIDSLIVDIKKNPKRYISIKLL